MRNYLLIGLIGLLGFLMPTTTFAGSPAEASPEHFIPPLKKKIKIPIVIIDAGHGGDDYGTTSDLGILEKDVTLDVAHRTEKYLKQMGFEVRMTRTEDKFIRLSDRVRFSENHQGDLFLSIHANAAPNKKATGFETFFHSPNKEAKGIEKYGGLFTYLSLSSKQKKSLKLAKLVQSELSKATQAENRGIKMAKFHVLRNSSVPAVLVEAGFLSNEGEAKLLNTSDYRNKIARALAQSVRRYCRW